MILLITRTFQMFQRGSERTETQWEQIDRTGIEHLELRNKLKPICGIYFTVPGSFNLCVCVFPGKSQVMGEIKIALKKEMKTEGEQLVLEILQCRNITYKFKTPDHLPGNGK